MTENAIVGIFTLLGSAIGVAIGGYIGYATSIIVADRKEFQKAAIDFYDAFLDAKMSLDYRYCCNESTEKNVYEILNRTFPQQMKAMLRFRLYLPSNKRESFNKAWREYCGNDAEGEPEHPFLDQPSLEQYLGKTLEGQPTRELALKRIDKLLNFAESAYKSPFKIKALANKLLKRTGKKPPVA